MVIVRGHDNPKLYKSKVTVTDVDWVYDEKKVGALDPIEVEFQHHSLSRPTKIKLWCLKSDGVVELELVDSVRHWPRVKQECFILVIRFWVVV